MTTLAETLSKHATGLTYDDMPHETVHLAKRFNINTMGCAIRGYGSEPARVAWDMKG